VADVEGLVDGLAALAKSHGVSVAGGNIARTDGPLVIDVTAGGEVAPRKWLTRSGARAGDDIYVSGSVGGAAAGLEMLKSGSGIGDPGCVARHRRPEPRVRLGVAMGRARAARAAMDLSDGLADAVHQVAAASQVGVRLDAALLPIDACARHWWNQRGTDAVTAAIAGGDDYELLFAVPAKGAGRLRAVTRQVAEPVLTRVGVFTKDAHERVLIRDGNEDALPEGFEHFANR
jgi:thiamine-monophosphate kinase